MKTTEKLKEGMEYCTPRSQNEIAPQYLVTLAEDRHIMEVMNCETQERMPIWQHPKLTPYKEQIMSYGLTPDVYEDDEGVVWLNTLAFDAPYDDTLDVIDVVGPFNQGVRYSGMLHMNEDWKCTYSTADELGLFMEACEKQAS
ncbi:MAG: hypothetical protein FWC39_07445 [Bacteroidetes bacterium]|nr:hypothetical protein [Bacteroidota bacterium]